MPNIARRAFIDKNLERRKKGIVRRFKADPEQAPANGIPAIIAWLAGTATANFLHWGITAINGMLVAAIVYTLLAVSLAPKKQN